VIGSASFLKRIAVALRECYGIERKRDVYPMRAGEWGGLRSFRNLQVEPVLVPTVTEGD
jgi:hypothetical protein